MKKSTFIFLFLLPVLSGFGQYYDFFPEEQWRRWRHHIEFGIGTSNFLGDLGGKDAVGTNDLRDLEWSQYHLAGYLGYRYAFHKYFFGRVNFAYGRLTGDDQLTKEAYRQNRNLNFRSNVFEIDLMAEFQIRLSNKKGHQHNLKRTNAETGPWRIRASYFSVFGGVGLFHFNPKTNLDGSWIELHPLKTEGQGLPGGPKEYKLWQLNIPVGFNFMFRVDRKWMFGIEAMHRYTFTDYVDDVSSSYYNPYDIALYNDDGMGDVAAYLSNPSLGLANGGLPDIVTAPGQQRGDVRDNDGYFYVVLKADYLIMKKANFDQKRTLKMGKHRKFKNQRPIRH
ncbi:MAG: DUF6089 family protein [Flavobacteriales bacterium]|nr:DUF6089 family protein [Flavobacteriales bacterium]